MKMRVQYQTDEEKETIINQNKDIMTLEVEEYLFEGNFLVFSTLETDFEIISDLKNRLAEQDMVLEEIMFVIIPEMMGGGM